MSKNKNDLEGRISDYLPISKRVRDLATYTVILGILLGLVGSAKVTEAEKKRKRLEELSTQQRFEQTLKQNSYDSSSAAFDRFLKKTYEGIRKGYEERKELLEYLNNKINTLSEKTSIFLPDNIVNNGMYKSTLIHVLNEDFHKYNPNLDAKYFVGDCLKYKIDPIVAASIFFHETKYDTLGVGRMNNPAGIRGNGDAGSRDGFARYSTWQRGVDAFVNLLKDYPAHFLKPRGINNANISNVVRTWAPSGDGNNNPNTYVKTILYFMKEKNSCILRIINNNSKK